MNQREERRLDERFEELKDQRSRTRSPIMQMNFDTDDFVTHGQFHEFKNELIEVRKNLRDLRDRYFEDKTKEPEDDPLL